MLWNGSLAERAVEVGQWPMTKHYNHLAIKPSMVHVLQGYPDLQTLRQAYLIAGLPKPTVDRYTRLANCAPVLNDPPHLQTLRQVYSLAATQTRVLAHVPEG
jgi:hypothetical protein